MGKKTVYEGLKNALKVKRLPFAALDEENLTILFASWEQYRAFDRALDRLPTPEGIKLNIYAEKVNGRSDGVAVTVSDDVQNLTYWQMYPDMEAKVGEFENFISKVLRFGIQILDFDYYTFVVEFDEYEFFKFSYEFHKNPRHFLSSNYYISHPESGRNGMERRIFHFDFFSS